MQSAAFARVPRRSMVKLRRSRRRLVKRLSAGTAKMADCIRPTSAEIGHRKVLPAGCGRT